MLCADVATDGRLCDEGMVFDVEERRRQRDLYMLEVLPSVHHSPGASIFLLGPFTQAIPHRSFSLSRFIMPHRHRSLPCYSTGGQLSRDDGN